MKSLIRCSMFLCCAMAALPGLAQKPAVKLTVTHQPEVLSPGSPFVMTVTAAKPLISLEAYWADRKIIFSSDQKAGIWRGVGVVVAKLSGEETLILAGKTKSGRTFSQTHLVQVVSGNFPTELITSLPEPLNEILSVESSADVGGLSGEVLSDNDESKSKKEAFSRVSLSPLWVGNFAEPLDQLKIMEKESSNFGEKIALRKFKPHRGEDLRVGERTPVKAMNSGLVVLAAEMSCEGRMIVLDHGQGWLSVYLHLSKINVVPKQRVAKEEIIALSGQSGACCHGPHLHVGVRWQGIYVNPAAVLSLDWPSASPVLTKSARGLAAKVGQAVWHSETQSPIAFGCAGENSTGCAMLHGRAKLEDGSSQTDVIELRPIPGGSLVGAFNLSTPLQRGDKFRVRIGFAAEARDGKAILRVSFQSQGRRLRQEMGILSKNYDRSLLPWEIDFSAYAGQRGTLILEAINLNAPSVRSGICWINPRIER